MTVNATPGHGVDAEEVEISYSELKEIGQGTFGIVYRARLCETGEVVAIKKTLDDPKFKVGVLDANVLVMFWLPMYWQCSRCRCTGNVLDVHVPAMLWMSMFWQCSGCRCRPYWQCSGNVLDVNVLVMIWMPKYWQCSGNVLDVNVL